MKAIHGLIIAIFLGIAAALFNFAYLNKRAQTVDKVDFIGVKKDVVINRGDRLSGENLTRVRIPKAAMGNLSEYAVRYEDLASVEGMNVWRTLSDQALLLREHLTMPPRELELEDDERAMWIPVDSRAFVPSLVVPGDLVMFLVLRSPLLRPTPALSPEGAADPLLQPLTPMRSRTSAAGSVERIGPFKVLAIGNRLGDPRIHRKQGMPQHQENVLTISVKETGGKMDPKAEKLWSLLQATDFRSVGIVLYDQTGRKKRTGAK